MTDVIVVGAGLAGLAAARELTAAGASVVLCDKAYRVGGRCATRDMGTRVVQRGSADPAIVDTGAQFFTVRSDQFRAHVEQWIEQGCPIREWCRGFAHAASVDDPPSAATSALDGHPRFSVAGGMNVLPQHLAQGLDTRTSTRAVAVRHEGSSWAVLVLDERMRVSAIRSRAVVLTPPVPQTLALLETGDVRPPDELRARLAAMGYEPSLTLMVALDRTPSLPEPGGVQFPSGAVSWMADNQAKGASTAPSLTVHASGSWSETFYDADPDISINLLLDAIQPWIGTAQPVAAELFRWRYAKPVFPSGDGALLITSEPGPLVLAGDAFAGAKVEGAVTSGLAAARLLSSLG